MNLNLTGKTALICGASMGIGAASAKELAALGARVIVLARTATKLEKLVAELPNTTTASHSYIAVDMNDHKALAEKLHAELKKNGSIEILINNSGGPAPGRVTAATAEQFDQAFQQHLQTSVLLAKILIPGMQERGYGRIINILSSSIKIPIAELAVSTTVRWAVASWAKLLSQEVARYGITVNNVLPGSIKTERLISLMESYAKKQNVALENIEKQRLTTIPAQRFGEPTEIANVIAFLASPAASYVNGVALAVDGGSTGCF